MTPDVDTVDSSPDDSTTDAGPSDAEKVSAVQEQIASSLRGDLDAQWDEVLDEWPGAARAETKAVRAYVSGLRNRMLRSLTEIDALDELERGVAIQYIEVKCHWTMLNTQIQHQTSTQGQAAGDLMYRATCVSLIIQSLEPLLSRDRVDNLTNFLADPM